MSPYLLRFVLHSTLLVLVTSPVRASPGPYDYETVQVAPGVYGFFERRLNPIVSGNVVAVVGTDAVLVFDTGHHPPITRQIIADLKQLTPKPVKYVVVSHWHDDHWVGNAEFADAYPGVTIIAHSFTAKLLEERKRAFGGEPCKTELMEQVKPLRAQLVNGKRPDGTPISEGTRTRLTQFVEAFDVHLTECDGMRFRRVDRTVDSTTTLDLGGRTVELRFLGRGNTAGDLVAWIPDSRTLLTGDLVVFPFPFATQSYVSEWAAVLRHIDSMDLATIVPGHGAVMHDKVYLEDVAAALESIATQAHTAWHPGMTADQLREKIDLTTVGEKFSHGDPFIKANFDYMMKGPAVDRMWQELSGAWKPEGDG